MGVTLDKRRGLFLFSPPGFHGEATLIADVGGHGRQLERSREQMPRSLKITVAILKISFLPFALSRLLRAVEILLLSPSSFLSFSFQPFQPSTPRPTLLVHPLNWIFSHQENAVTMKFSTNRNQHGNAPGTPSNDESRGGAFLSANR